MKKTYNLTVLPRTETGHLVKNIRNQGNLPATIYGKGYQAASITVDTEQFKKLYQEAGETHVVQLTLSEQTVPVLIHTAQQHPVTQQIQHIEFLKVNLKEKIKTFVPVSIIGDSPAVEQNLGTVMQVLQEVEIEALPNDLPETLQVDITTLEEVNSEKKVSDLVVPEGVTVLSDMEQTVVKIGSIVVEAEPVAEVATEDTAAPTDATEEPAKETETPSEE